MVGKLLWLAGALTALSLPYPAIASTWLPFGNEATIDVIYSGIITSGYDATGIISAGTAGSLAGDTAVVSFAYELSQGTYTNNGSSSSYTNFDTNLQTAPTPVQWAITIASPSGDTIGAMNGASTSGLDAASVGTTNQSASLILPEYGEMFSINASASNPLISSSILQSYSIDNIFLSLAFSFSGTDCQVQCFNAYGNMIFGDISATYTPQLAVTPLPASLPLFLTGLGVLGVFCWRKKQKIVAGQTATGEI